MFIDNITTNGEDWYLYWNSTNCLTNLTLEEKVGSVYTVLEANPLLNRTDTILRLNGTMNSDLVEIGDSNLSVYLDGELVYEEVRLQNTTYFGEANFSEWYINDDITTDGIK